MSARFEVGKKYRFANYGEREDYPTMCMMIKSRDGNSAMVDTFENGKFWYSAKANIRTYNECEELTEWNHLYSSEFEVA